ncbi:NTP transferase domain-containing protein [Emticicia sp. SJ17W-69]|uniref:NTP transferase domain-containing protein n=1 Tax=Emticicia sp. SJ17W-69 TaxID=3421657 RepID=UPI003EC09442
MNCLILIGGKSSRMGTDKSMLDYHGKPQREYLFDLAQQFCSEVYFSCREEQKFSEETIIDSYPELGPMNGILSAFMYNKNVAWLVVACDMPLINEESFEILINNRNPDKVATTFFNNENNAPDPLFTIYEPKAADLLIAYVKLGNKSPKLFLQNADIQLIQLENIDFLKNINTKEEFDKLKRQ